MRTSIRTFQYLVFKTANVQVEHFVISCSISSKSAGAGRAYTFCLVRDFGAHKLYTFRCLFLDCAKLVVHQNTFRCLVFETAGGASVQVLFLNKCTDCALSNVLLKIVQKCRCTRTPSNVLFSKLLISRLNTF